MRITRSDVRKLAKVAALTDYLIRNRGAGEVEAIAWAERNWHLFAGFTARTVPKIVDEIGRQRTAQTGEN